MKSLPLNAETSIPILGFGVWQLRDDECVQSVLKALEVGFRHIDTADRYGNHAQVAQAIKESGIDRNELFITTKVPPTDIQKETLIADAKRYLEELQMDYVDLLLIHWPNKDIPIQESLEAMQELKQQGLIKAIGVSNFTIRHLEEALATGIEVSNNQVEFHPSLNQKRLKEFCDQHEITITAYSPIAQGQDLELPLIQELATKYDRSPAQVILNWLMAKNIVAIPRSSKPERIEDSFKSTEWELSPEDVQRIDELNTDNRLVMPPHAEFSAEAE